MAELTHVATHDPLTGLANRLLLTEQLTEAYAERRPLLLVLADLNGFKHINDTRGHAFGDRVLSGIAADYGEQCRRVA